MSPRGRGKAVTSGKVDIYGTIDLDIIGRTRIRSNSAIWKEGTEKPGKPGKSVEKLVARKEDETARSSRSRRARRATARQSKAPEAEEAQRHSAAGEPAERAAAARDAVASLKAGLQERGAAPEVVGPASLAELEAHLPRRDR